MSGSNHNKPLKDANSYIKYAGIGFQMLAVIGVFAYLGHKIDERRHSNPPLFTALLGLIGVVIALYQVVRTLTKNK